MASRGKMMVELTLKKARQQQGDQTVAVKANKRVQKDIVPSLGMSVNMPVSVTVAETVRTMSSSDESRPVQAVVMTDDVRTDMPAITNQDPEIAMDEGPDSDIDETPARPAADQGPENDDHGDEEMNEVPQQQRDVSRPKKRRRIEDQKAHNKDKYQLLDGCKEMCRKKCQTKFTNEQRIHINESYWDLSFFERRLWLDGHILVTPVKSRKNTQDQYKRSHSLIYSLPLSTSKEPVCKFMFLRTLGLKTDGMISEFVRRKETGEVGTLIKDNRGKAAPKNKLDKDLIREHIMSHHPQVSHYKLQNAPKKRYLEPQFTITAMWEDYKSKHGDISYIVYQRVFQSENIGFDKPSQDDCDVCAKYKAHCKDPDEAHDVDACEECKVGRDHEKAKAACTHYREDRDGAAADAENTSIFTLAVITCM